MGGFIGIGVAPNIVYLVYNRLPIILMLMPMKFGHEKLKSVKKIIPKYDVITFLRQPITAVVSALLNDVHKKIL